MKCTSPRTVGFKADGKTLSWTRHACSYEFGSFQLPCGKCLACRLEYSRSWAIRCVHEAKMHEKNVFITLTYSDENLPKDGKLHYEHFQKFMKDLRDKVYQKFLKSFGEENYKLLDKKERKKAYEPYQIGMFVTGEYGDQTKRPHWHAILFNWCPEDGKRKYKNELGDQVYDSEELTKLWGNGIAEYGSVSFRSAGYVARYAAKKLGHGNDQDHEYHPISKKSSKHAIGKKWLEKYWTDAFNNGEIVLIENSQLLKCSIPRYYEKWLKQHKPEDWFRYVTKTKTIRNKIAANSRNVEKERSRIQNQIRWEQGNGIPCISRSRSEKIILEQKFKQQLQSKLKL